MHRLRYEVFALGELHIVRAVVGVKRAADFGVRNAEKEMLAAHALHAEMEPALTGRNIRIDGILRIRAGENLHGIHAYRVVGAVFQVHRIDAHDFPQISRVEIRTQPELRRGGRTQHQEKCRCKDLPFHRHCVMRQIEERRGLFSRLRKVLPVDSVLQCCHGFCFNMQNTNFFRKAVRAVQHAV